MSDLTTQNRSHYRIAEGKTCPSRRKITWPIIAFGFQVARGPAFDLHQDAACNQSLARSLAGARAAIPPPPRSSGPPMGSAGTTCQDTKMNGNTENDDPRLIARKLFDALCMRLPDRYIALVESSGHLTDYLISAPLVPAQGSSGQ